MMMYHLLMFLISLMVGFQIRRNKNNLHLTEIRLQIKIKKIFLIKLMMKINQNELNNLENSQ